MYGPSFLSPPFPYPGANFAPMAVFGADPSTPAAPSALDKFKSAMAAQNSVIPVKNGYLLGAGALLGVGIYAGWFRKKRSSHDRRRRHHRRHY